MVEHSFWIWTAALESGYLPHEEFERWVDGEILRLDAPPKWMLEVSLAISIDEALSALWRAWDSKVQSSNSTDFRDGKWGPLHLGFLYLRFERGGLGMANLLMLAGFKADDTRCGIPCERFFLLRTEIDGGGPTVPSDTPLAARVADVFAPFVERARREIDRLPFIPV